MAGVTPYNIHVGHDQVKSDVNLPRCMRWLGELAESQPREARRVQLALSITIHADQEERARGRPDIMIPAVGELGEFPWVWCSKLTCHRCVPEGRGGYHFRHIGPWTGDADISR